ncbi:FHA domain-containing protein At4g14490-like [Mercurialis annua]|uniref:FHA domain-containing protein At4g14490-like n=1 Tax=Mercurialis annua TaxID=3986 RepID=UPI00215E59EA|nr:FHA domain-containing protein At4g14490-like [Mercurialis annua]
MESLKLIIQQGPRKGETVEFPPESIIKIGRSVRGNNLTIKDLGISFKHLIIRHESESSSDCKWIIEDLNSSNGTIINSASLPPFTPFQIRHGDVLNLGEDTSILVQFFIKEEEVTAEKPSQLRRNPRRKVQDNSAIKIDENAAVVIQLPKPRKGRLLKEPPPLAEARVSDEGEGLGELETEKVNARVTRGRRVELENKGLENVEKIRVTRKRENAESAVVENVANYRVTRSRKNVAGSVIDFENLDGKKTPEKNASLGFDLVDEAKEQVNEEAASRDKVEKKEGSDVGLNSREETNDHVNEVDISRNEEIKCQSRSHGKGRVNESDNLGKEKVTFDLEKMTLGQWFDYMEEYLPKQLFQVTEQMILDMKMKAERVKEYIIEQKKAKAAAAAAAAMTRVSL